jgi:23S rRNA (cytidine1920-2'-O)/16S rRNA (cytidine1409-2'-O)-methyltransferase
MNRLRLDQLLVERGLAQTRTRAQALVLAGKVRVGHGDAARADRKPGDLVDTATPVEVEAPEPYVSRGGYKLAHALDAFGIEPAGRICLDVGSSTGGFTDVLLQRGAARVYALDVGRGQLAELLRRDPRVVSMERTNARTLDDRSLPEAVSLATIDVSFISLGRVLGPVATTLDDDNPAEVVPLVKPQFEAGREHSRKGVVGDPAVHLAVLRRAVEQAGHAGFSVVGVTASPITGPEGNREFLLHLRAGGDLATPSDLDEQLRAVAAA